MSRSNSSSKSSTGRGKALVMVNLFHGLGDAALDERLLRGRGDFALAVVVEHDGGPAGVGGAGGTMAENVARVGDLGRQIGVDGAAQPQRRFVREAVVHGARLGRAVRDDSPH